MKFFLPLILLVALAQNLCGNAVDKGEIGSSLFKTLHPFVFEDISDGLKRFSYCPDNLCFEFEAPASVEWNRIYDFSVLFFLYKSDFPEFVEFGYEMPSKISPREEFLSIEMSIIDHYQDCHQADQSQRAICVLRHLNREYSVRAFFVREDEGYRARSEQKTEEDQKPKIK